MDNQSRPSIEAVLYHAQKEGTLPITSECNMSCIFCSNCYNPVALELFDLGVRSYEDIESTIDWLQASRSPVVIGESVTRIREGEPLTHPRFLDIVKLVRKHYPERPVRVTTNGVLLDGRLIDQLSRLGVELLLSLNTVGFRKEVMGDQDPEKTLANIPMLKGKVKFEGSVVALPFVTGWEDIKNTVDFLDKWGASVIRLLAPGFSSAHPLAGSVTPGLWEELREFGGALKKKTKAAILVVPPGIKDLMPIVENVIPGSPAHRSGMKPGDMVKSVAGKTSFSRKDAFLRARYAENPKMTILRDGGEIQVRLAKDRFQSPGFIMYEDIGEDEWMEWERKSGIRKGKEVLILTSSIAKEMVESALRNRGLKAVVKSVRSRFFGGNIQAGGLLTVDDFWHAYKKAVGNRQPPHVVTLPGRAFDNWGRDLTGKSYRWFQEMAGVQVVVTN